jgi:hypothetical protein
MASSPPPPPPPIVVTAQRLNSGFGIRVSDGPGATPREIPTDGGTGETPPEELCVDVSAYPEEERRNLLALLEVGKAFREIMNASTEITMSTAPLFPRFVRPNDPHPYPTRWPHLNWV